MKSKNFYLKDLQPVAHTTSNPKTVALCMRQRLRTWPDEYPILILFAEGASFYATTRKGELAKLIEPESIVGTYTEPVKAQQIADDVEHWAGVMA